MPGCPSRSNAPLTRRDIAERGFAFGLGLAATAVLPRRLAAQTAPPSTPAGGGLVLDPEQLVNANTLLAADPDPALAFLALMPSDEFERAHIPGSLQIDWPRLEVIDTSDASITRWRQEMDRLFMGLGITAETHIVTYDGGSLFATRPWWVLRQVGHRETRVLNGGLAAWRAAGGEVASGPASAAPAASPPASPATAPSALAEGAATLAQLSEVRARLGDANVVLVDARTPEEYASGHIPGAVNINDPRNAQAEPPKYWRPVDELEALYEQVGVTPDKRVIPYCATGVRSSVTFFTLRLIGYPDVALYTGSWEEWRRHPELPVTTGSEP